MLSLVIRALKKLVMFLCVPFANRCLIYSDWAFEITLHSSSARRDSPCADSPYRDSGFTWSPQCPKRLNLYEFTLWGRDLVSVVRIRESPYYGGVFLKKIYENFVGTLETVRNREVSVPRGSTVFWNWWGMGKWFKRKSTWTEGC